MKNLVEEARECVAAFDEAYEEGMDHEQGFDFARNTSFVAQSEGADT